MLNQTPIVTDGISKCSLANSSSAASLVYLSAGYSTVSYLQLTVAKTLWLFKSNTLSKKKRSKLSLL